jgi:glycerol-3-phosphate dehydrogenase
VSAEEGARAIIGAGSWGTALAIVLAPRFERIRLWAHEADLVERMCSTRINDVFLPGFSLPLNVEPTADLGYALEDAGIVVGVMPSRFARPLYREMLPHLEPEMRFVSATKGLEQGTLLRMSEVARQVIGREIRTARGGSFRAHVCARGGARGAHRGSDRVPGSGTGRVHPAGIFGTHVSLVCQRRPGGR